MDTKDPSNPLFSLASDLVNYTSRNLFLTGKAGTGKTTFLRYIRENCPKKMAVVAPTGVAAINAAGVTIHSFFQLPFGPYIPVQRAFSAETDSVSDKHSLISRLRFNSERRRMIQELELLVIDEISMVRGDVLDAVDVILRHFRNRHSEKFGGVQVLLIGDLFQLPPVVKEQEWGLLKDYYKSPYFFDSKVFQDEPPVCVEFTKIYRQTEERFIGILNAVRNNSLDPESYEALHDRYQPEFFNERTSGYILLTTHNEIARGLNARELEKLEGALQTYTARVDNDFPANAYPADDRLQLKKGAQVMFIRNDQEKGKRFFNGKIGIVEDLREDLIAVRCEGEEALIEVKRELWENIRYSLNRSTRQLEEDVMGTFSQFPLRLAWAITIHKSQGLTFEKAIIDAGEAFAPGQVYVALSRCTSLEGLVLHSRIRKGSLFTDSRIVEYVGLSPDMDQLQRELDAGRVAYQKKIILSLFDFDRMIQESKQLYTYLKEAGNAFDSNGISWMEILVKNLEELSKTAAKFHLQLERLFSQNEKLNENTLLRERLAAASLYFLGELKQLIVYISRSPVVTDGKRHAKEFNDGLKEIFTLVSLQVHLFQNSGKDFQIEAIQHARRSFVTPAFQVNAYAGVAEKKVDLAHPALYTQLKKLRDSICSKKNLPIYMVAGSKTLEEMATYLPANLSEMKEISGFGEIRVKTYGQAFLDLIIEYSSEKNLASTIAVKKLIKKRKEPKEARINTKEETLKLFQQGKSVQEIAKTRNLALSTIEGHLASYILDGLLPVEKLIPAETLTRLETELQDMKDSSITEAKSKLGERASYGEIRFVLASLRYRENLSAHKDH